MDQHPSHPTATVTATTRKSRYQVLKQRIIEVLATAFYVGKIRWMPGTFGTLWGLPLAWILVQGGPYFYMFATVLLLFLAVGVSELHELHFQAHDSSEVVIDEIVGYLVALTWLPSTWQSFVAAFLLFRFFDILKPFPIGYIDRKIHGGLGTVLDDVAAGLASNILLQILYAKTIWLGTQLQGT